ncbi:MAG: hypothetical protein A3K19_15125 [Lentisphaerae bacterium RIFOXYB12_FULL_65_16]|nr:MAG: hypothetical protein A3K18_01710 [Lentisphaerae bacterium RIFOXYA12_64_32]OGV85965.1 MAG: hypothetical protein A3K19_15125 [Lentisphaerae bacterium RIFOXYB12_FULL_65_16]
MSWNSRQNEILDLLGREGEVVVETLAAQFGVSEMTIRRDLTRLARAGKLSRTHGGAMPSRAGIVEFSFQENLNRNAEQKRAIAQAAARAVQPGMTVLLDTGSTTLEVARAIAGLPKLTVLTTSLMIAAALHTQESIELILLGGTVRKDSPDLSGPLTEENLGRFRVNLAVLGADGVSADGVFTESMNVARVSRAIVKAAERAVLTIDGSKFGRAALVRYAEWQDFNQVITDKGVPAQVRKWLNRKGPEVVYA